MLIDLVVRFKNKSLKGQLTSRMVQNQMKTSIGILKF